MKPMQETIVMQNLTMQIVIMDPRCWEELKERSNYLRIKVAFAEALTLNLTRRVYQGIS